MYSPMFLGPTDFRFNVVARYKWKAWESQRGKSKHQAMQDYVQTIVGVVRSIDDSQLSPEQWAQKNQFLQDFGGPVVPDSADAAASAAMVPAAALRAAAVADGTGAAASPIGATADAESKVAAGTGTSLDTTSASADSVSSDTAAAADAAEPHMNGTAANGHVSKRKTHGGKQNGKVKCGVGCIVCGAVVMAFTTAFVA